MEDLQVSKNIQHDPQWLGSHPYTSAKAHTTYKTQSEPKHKRWMLGDAVSVEVYGGGLCGYMQRAYVRIVYLFLFSFAMNPETALEKKVY